MNTPLVMAEFSRHYLQGYRGLTLTAVQHKVLSQAEESLMAFLQAQPEGSRQGAREVLDLSLTTDEETVLDRVVRQWQASRALGEPVHTDFGEHYTTVQWAALVLCITRMTTLAGELNAQHSTVPPSDTAPPPDSTADTLALLMRLTKGIASRYNALRPLGRLLDELEGTQAPSGFAFGRV